MAKIKRTKIELKAQRTALARYERYLPMLQLKKQQLQLEIHNIDLQIAEKERADRQRRSELASWLKLLSEPCDLGDLIQVESIRTEEGNVAGVSTTLLRDVLMKRIDYDLFETPAWIDDAIEALDKLTRLRIEREILSEQRRRIREELRITTQRVNLFEKVKIPECRESIRVIKIFLGDEQTAAVARAKLAKNRAVAYEEAIPP